MTYWKYRRWHWGVIAILSLCGCGTMKEVTPEEFLRSPAHGARYVILQDGTTLTFSQAGPRSGFVHNGEIIGTLSDSTMVYLSPAKIRSVAYYDSKAPQSILLGVLGLGAIVGVFFALSLGGGGWL